VVPAPCAKLRSCSLLDLAWTAPPLVDPRVGAAALLGHEPNQPLARMQAMAQRRVRRS
jgi:hypothetical protein